MLLVGTVLSTSVFTVTIELHLSLRAVLKWFPKNLTTVEKSPADKKILG